MAKSKGPVKLSNLLSKGKKRFGDKASSEDDSFDFLKERDELLRAKKEGPVKTALRKEVDKKEHGEKKKASFDPLDIQEAPVKNKKPKSVTNKTDNKKTTKQVTNRQQTDSKKISSDNEKDIQLDNRTDNTLEKDNNQTFKSVLPVVTPSNAIEIDYRELSGNERNLLAQIFHECLREGGLETGKIRVGMLAGLLKCSTGTTKMTLHRLKKKGFISVCEHHRGRGGWSRYSISKDLHQKLQNDEIFFNFDPKWITKRVTEQITIGPSSSSNFNINNKTTNSKKITSLPVDWDKIVIPKELKDIRFGKPHLFQLLDRGILTAEQVQDSLDHFTYDLVRGAINARSGPLTFLMGVLVKNGQPYASEHYLSYLKDEWNRKQKLLEEYQAYKVSSEKKVIEAKFNSFWEKLSQNERDDYLPPNPMAASGSEIQKILAKAKFSEEGREE